MEYYQIRESGQDIDFVIAEEDNFLIISFEKLMFLKDNGITIDDFEYVGKCDSECPECDAEGFSVWRRDIGFIEDENIFAFHLDAADEILDFAIYWCNKCGK
ncbi:hypothetical protein [Desnuesiella massiliensis]|uniref:hypothetical protein n=1 Tax=Desnuesiella massiliensis TaxID=1650662 RepID=UPI000AA98E53|nr:hypothetical protein [Desnuesiella massiliensis]